MKSLVATALLLCSHSGAVEEDSSLIQGTLVARHTTLSSSDSKEARKDATAQLMETATQMMKNGVTPDVVVFIETTITEVNQNVLQAIVDEHDRDQATIYRLWGLLNTTVYSMQACANTVNGQHTARTEASLLHKTCRSEEALDCARSRKCEDELSTIWNTRVKVQEEEMRRIHSEIYNEWCVAVVPDHPSLADPFEWPPAISKEGPETSQSTDNYPAVDLEADVITFRTNSVREFTEYMERKPMVEAAWLAYNTKIIECAELEQTLADKTDVCDAYQDTVHDQACSHATANSNCRETYGRDYESHLTTYNNAKATIQIQEADRKREWETLHIVTCLLETVYTHVIHSIDSGEPCPTESSNPEQTTSEIQSCHEMSDSFTANLTIIYPDPPCEADPSLCAPIPSVVPPPCTAGYIWEEHGQFPSDVRTSYSQDLTTENLGSWFTTLSSAGWAGCAAPKACVPCSNADDPVVVTDYDSHTDCKLHQAYLLPGQMDADSFKCLDGTQCILASGRCNGVDNCDDGSDESNCSPTWGVPAILQGAQACTDSSPWDVQFQCGQGADALCVPKAARCNGVQNCPNNEDEQGCSASDVVGTTLEPTTGLTASIVTPAVSSDVFGDRQYTFDSLGSFTNHKMVKMSNEDKFTRATHVQMKLRLQQPTVVYVAKLASKDLSWLSTDGWAQTSLTGVTYHGIHQTRHTDWASTTTEQNYDLSDVWQKTFPAGTVEMRGNDGGDGSYLMFVANPAAAPTPDVVLWTQHMADSGRVKCNNNVNVQYVGDQATCQQVAVNNGHPFYSFRHNANSNGHKCMSSATCDSPLLNRVNDWYIYTSTPATTPATGFEVLSVDHCCNIPDGQFFNFNYASSELALGIQWAFDDQVTVRNERTGTTGIVVLWNNVNGGSTGDSHGQWVSGAAGGDWMVGDRITIAYIQLQYAHPSYTAATGRCVSMSTSASGQAGCAAGVCVGNGNSDATLQDCDTSDAGQLFALEGNVLRSAQGTNMCLYVSQSGNHGACEPFTLQTCNSADTRQQFVQEAQNAAGGTTVWRNSATSLAIDSDSYRNNAGNWIWACPGTNTAKYFNPV